MKMGNVGLSIIIAEVTDEIRDIDGLENRLKEAMKRSYKHWTVTDEEEQMLGAIGATMNSYGEGTPEYERLKKTLDQRKKLVAFFMASDAGLSVDLSLGDEESDDVKIVMIIPLWEEAKKEKDGN